MKKEIILSWANRLINSGNVVLVTSSYKDKQNILTVAWHTPLSHKPPLVGLALSKKHLSSELIKKGEEFIINIPSRRLFQQVLYCGSVSGREKDKFKEACLTAQKAKRLTRTVKILECIGYLECYLRDIKEIGDHFFFIGEVIYAEVEDYLFEETWKEEAELIYHLGGKNFGTLKALG